MSALAVSLAAQAPAGGGGGGRLLITMLLMAVVFYLLLVRPQQKKARQQQALLSALGRGDRVITIGGIHGTVVEMDDETVQIEVAPGTVLTMARQAIGRRISELDENDAVETDETPLSGDVSAPSLETDQTGTTSADPTDQR